MPGDDGFQRILSPWAFGNFSTEGFLRTGIVLPEGGKQVRSHFERLGPAANNWAKIFNNATQHEQDHVTKSQFVGNVYNDQTMLDLVVTLLLREGIARFFAMRYLLISHDIFLKVEKGQKSFGAVHWDGKCHQQPFEGPQDLSFYIPLTRVSANTGGRLRALPTISRKVHSSIRKSLEVLDDAAQQQDSMKLDDIFDVGWEGRRTSAFATATRGKFDRAALQEKVPKRRGVAHFNENYRSMDAEVGQYGQQFGSDSHNFPCTTQAHTLAGPHATCESLYTQQATGIGSIPLLVRIQSGEVMIISERAFHQPEKWLCRSHGRGVYVIRLMPVYDVPVTLRDKLGSEVANRHFIDLKAGRLIRRESPIDIRTFPKSERHLRAFW